MTKTYKQTIIEAFKIMFPEKPVSSHALYMLDKQQVRDSYRRLVKQYHPDLSSRSTKQTLAFSDIVASYEILCRFILEQNPSSDGSYSHNMAPHGQSRSTSSKTEADRDFNKSRRFSGDNQKHSFGPRETVRKHMGKSQSSIHQPPQDPGMKHEYFYNGSMPQHRMQIGMFLYHKGVVSYQALARALAWQRSCRPRFGELAKSWGFMSDSCISKTLRDSKSSDKFGERAINLGYLRKDQRGIVALHQLSLQPAIGRYFVANCIVSELQLQHYIAEMNRHNRLFTIK